MIIVDECFVAGTLVSTPSGRYPIEHLRAGDKVLTTGGVARIKRLVRNTATRLVEVKLGNGETIRCTPEHPFFTNAGWVCAKNLTGRRLISGIELSCLRAGIPAATQTGTMGYDERLSDWTDLLEILRTEEIPLPESRGFLLQQDFAGATGQTVRPVATRTQGEVIGTSEGEGAQATDTRRQRHGDDSERVLDFRGLACGVGMELPSSVGREAARLSYELQTRLCVASPQDMFGSGRKQPPNNSGASAGSEKGSKATGTWVESVSYIERPNGIDVFNLEIEGTPNYLIGDHWLVHNCAAYKNASTTRWKTLQRVIKPQTMLWMMTGTPAAQSPMDAFGLARLVNPNGVPKYANAWRDKVMYKATQFKWVPKMGANDTVFTALQPAIRFTKAECLDLPPVLTEARDVPLTAQQKKYYKMLKEQLVMEAAGEVISAVNAATAVSKLLQISAGAAYSDDKEVVQFDCTPRTNVLLEVIDETPRKVIVFAPFRHSITTIEDALKRHGVSAETIHGDVSVPKRSAIFNAFQNKDEPRVLVIQPQAASHGVTLTAADTVVFWGPVMSVETYIQCCARADRQGQTSDKVTVVHLQGSDIERKMFNQLESRVADHSMLVKLYEEEVATKTKGV